MTRNLLTRLTIASLLFVTLTLHSKTLVVATYAYPNKDRGAAIKPLGEFIGQITGNDVVVTVLESPTLLIDAMRDKKVDIAVPNLAGFLYSRKNNLPVSPLVVPDVPLEKADEYRSVWIVKSASDVNSITDLVNKRKTLRIAMVWKDSMSGGIVPGSILHSHGLGSIDKEFKRLVYAGSHEKSFQALIDSRVDAAGLALGAFNRLMSKKRDSNNKYKTIWTSDPIPVGPLLCRSSKKLVCEALADTLITAQNIPPAVMLKLNQGWPEFGAAKRFVLPDIEKYENLLKAY